MLHANRASTVARAARHAAFEMLEQRRLLSGFPLDFGDAPDAYRTTLATGGAHHWVTPNMHLGLVIDAELDGQPSADAMKDDTTGSDDEDGIRFLDPIVPGTSVRVEVINGGVQGYSTFESSINLALRGVELEPDLVLVYHTINDMRCALYGEPRPDNTHWRAVWPLERRSALRALLEQSFVFRLARTHLSDYDELRSNLGGYVIVGFEPGNEDVYARSTPAETGFRSFERNLRTIVAVAREHGIRVAFVTQALQREDLRPAPSCEQQLLAFDRMTAMLRALGPAEGVPVIDAAPVLEQEARRQLETAGKQSIFTHEVHLQDAGADLLARTVAEGLRAADLLD